jgi:hypothetical protein
MKRRWGVVGFGIVLIALLGLWVGVPHAPACESCSAKEMPFFQIYSVLEKEDEARIKKFASLAGQTYPHFRVAVSADEAGFPDVEEWIRKYPDRFVKLPDGCQSQELIYRWIHSVPAEDIIVLFPPGGALDCSALERLKSFYSGSAAWLAFQGDIRKWAREGVLTGYATLFQKIKLQEFLEHGTFSENKAPENRLFELAGRHVRRLRGSFIEGKKYGYSWIARSRKPYPRYRPDEESLEPKTDLVVFSYDRPMQLYALLESIHARMAHLDTISVIYRTSSPPYDQGYEGVKQAFPSVTYFKQSDRPESDFKPLFLKAAFESPHPYVMLAGDEMVLRESIDLQEGIDQMEKTGAVCVYYRLGKRSPLGIRLGKELYAGQFSPEESPPATEMTLYRKRDLKKVLTTLNYTHPSALASKWALQRKANGVGIYYDTPKVVATSPRSKEELLKKFLDGLKLDIKPLQEYRGESICVDLDFVSQGEKR